MTQKKVPIGIPGALDDSSHPPGFGLTKTQGKKATKLDQGPGWESQGGLGLGKVLVSSIYSSYMYIYIYIYVYMYVYMYICVYCIVDVT